MLHSGNNIGVKKWRIEIAKPTYRAEACSENVAKLEDGDVKIETQRYAQVRLDFQPLLFLSSFFFFFENKFVGICLL